MADTFLKKEELRELLKAATDTSLTYQRINDRATKMNYEFWDLIKEKDLRIRELEQDLSEARDYNDELQYQVDEFHKKEEQKEKLDNAQFDKDITKILAPTKVDN